MHVLASAPGKVVVVGDYAVLEGAPAVVMALDRRARVRLSDGDDGLFCVDAPDLDIRDARGALAEARVRWQEADDHVADRLKLVTAVIEYLAGRDARPAPFRADLDTHAFFAGPDRGKLGLGSSAALVVALVGAIAAREQREVPDLPAMSAMHRHMQGGRGSGLDIATSLLGGVLEYRLQAGHRPAAAHRSWPRNLAFCCVWSGRPASTGDALARLADWRGRQRVEYDRHMRALTGIAAAAATALQAGDADAMLAAIGAYAVRLDELGRASGIDIVCAEHRLVADIAAACGVTYKTCGAGGGDVGMALSGDAGHLDQFARRATAAGFQVLDAGIDPQGLDVQTSTTSCNRRQPWTTYA